MHEWITYNPSRREVWRGHETKDGVRRSIAHAKRWDETLRIFVRDSGLPHLPTAYWEITADGWEAVFAKD
jgi:hypothetical protein